MGSPPAAPEVRPPGAGHCGRDPLIAVCVADGQPPAANCRKETTPMPEQGGAQVALFIDWDNIAISTAADHGGAIPDLRRIVQVAQSYGTLVIARAYAEWGV